MPQNTEYCHGEKAEKSDFDKEEAMRYFEATHPLFREMTEEELDDLYRLTYDNDFTENDHVTHHRLLSTSRGGAVYEHS